MQVRRERERKDAKEETRRQAYERDQKIQASMGRFEEPKLLGASNREKFTFEDDDGSQDEDENEILDGIDRLSGAVGKIHHRARGIGAHLDADPKLPERIANKVSNAKTNINPSGFVTNYYIDVGCR